MKCPRTFRVTDDNYGNLYINGAECIKEECGQWDKDQGCCSEVSKARAEWALVKVLQQISEKMPHEEQFRK